MANRAKGLATGVLSWFKKPWEITGPVSSPEFRDSISNVGDYRTHAPASQPQRAIVPQADPEHIFDIKYYLRDRRRMPAKVTVLEVSSSEGLEGAAPTASRWYSMGKELPMADEPGEGYQK